MINKKICFTIPFFGQLPPYSKLFFKSCETNPSYTFIFFTDLIFKEDLPNNVKVIKMNLNQFASLIEEKTNVKPNINFGWKICDFKPAYGLIFEDYIINGFEFWGIVDIDLILGNINYFITDELLENYDIISTLKLWLSGSFALFRNCEKVNNLYKESKDWEYVFSSERHCAFDECGRLNIKRGERIYDELRVGKSLHTLDTDIESYTHLLFDKVKSKGIKIYFNDLNCESIASKMILKFKNGMLSLFDKGDSNFKQNQRFLYYHFVNDKNKIAFNYPTWHTVPNEFYITNFGFFKKEQLRFLKVLKPFSYLKGILKVLFKSFPNKIRRKFF